MQATARVLRLSRAPGGYAHVGFSIDSSSQSSFPNQRTSLVRIPLRPRQALVHCIRHFRLTLFVRLAPQTRKGLQYQKLATIGLECTGDYNPDARARLGFTSHTHSSLSHLLTPAFKVLQCQSTLRESYPFYDGAWSIERILTVTDCLSKVLPWKRQCQVHRTSPEGAPVPAAQDQHKRG